MNQKLRDAFEYQKMIRYDPALDVFITWNGSSTFNTYGSDGEAYDCHTVYGAETNAGPCTVQEAYDAIDSLFADLHEPEVE